MGGGIVAEDAVQFFCFLQGQNIRQNFQHTQRKDTIWRKRFVKISIATPNNGGKEKKPPADNKSGRSPLLPLLLSYLGTHLFCKRGNSKK